MSKKKILITGAAGFIGYHLSCKLADQHSLTLVDNFSRNQMDDYFKALISSNGIKFFDADLTDKEFYNDLDSYYDWIFHLAAINGTKYFYEKPYAVLKTNILSLMNILEWINDKNCGKFLFSSSSEAYAGTISEYNFSHDYIPTDEKIPLCINDVHNERFSYGGSKLIGELLVINYFKKLVSSQYSIIRYHNIYGPRMGNEHVIPEFCNRIFKKENPFNIFGSKETRAFCYIDDAIDGTLKVMSSKKCDGEILHVGNDSEEIKIYELAKKLLFLNQSSADIKINPSPAGSVIRRCPNISKLKSLTNFDPKVNISKGLKIVSDWYIKNYTNS